jgi:hypothetical protein
MLASTMALTLLSLPTLPLSGAWLFGIRLERRDVNSILPASPRQLLPHACVAFLWLVDSALALRFL